MNTERTSRLFTLLAGVGIGAALTLFLEPATARAAANKLSAGR